MNYQNIREEELKNKISQDYFWKYDCTKITGNIDFCVSMHQNSLENTVVFSIICLDKLLKTK